MDYDFSNIDTVKAFFVILLGAAAAAVLVYIYDTSVAPAVGRYIPAVTPTAGAPAASTIATPAPTTTTSVIGLGGQ